MATATDNFNDTAVTTLVSHTADTGETWSTAPSMGGNMTISATGDQIQSRGDQQEVLEEIKAVEDRIEEIPEPEVKERIFSRLEILEERGRIIYTLESNREQLKELQILAKDIQNIRSQIGRILKEKRIKQNEEEEIAIAIAMIL